MKKSVLSVLIVLGISILPGQVFSNENLEAAEKLFDTQEYEKAVMGDSYRGWGKHKQAIKAYEKALEQDASQKEALMGMGMSYGNMRKYGEAIVPLKHLVEIEPSNALAHFYLGVSYEAMRSMNMAWEEYKILKTLDKELADKLYHIIFW
jgi:tetratricopeptide (TPR) repeat protein